MASIWFNNDPLQNLLNNNETDSYIPDTQKAQKGYTLCQLCCKQKQINIMYAYEDQQQKCGHLFCHKCLLNRLQYCIQNNQDIYCPVDACPYTMNTNGRFFIGLQMEVKDKYRKWKLTDQYKYRDTNKRLSFAESVRNSLRIQAQDLENVQNLEKMVQQEQQMMGNQQNFQGKIGSLRSSDKQKQQILIAREQQMHRRHTNTSILCKLLLIIFGIPFLILQFLISLALTIFIFLFSIISTVIAIFAAYTIIISIINQQYNIFSLIARGAGLLLCLILSYMSIKYRKQIYKNTVEVIWRTWITKVNKLYYYPQPYP